MTRDEMVALIRAGIREHGGTWADFGAGRGNFTRALRACTGPNATIYAIDRDAKALTRQHADVLILNADFTRPIQALPLLDGILIANALHFVCRQETVLHQLLRYLRPDGVLIVVEYDVQFPRGFIPYPLPFTRLQTLIENPQRIGERQSPSNNMTMYAASARRIQ